MRNISDINPVLVNDTCWSSAYHMIERFTDLLDALISVAESEQSNLVIDTRPSFKLQTHAARKC